MYILINVNHLYLIILPVEETIWYWFHLWICVLSLFLKYDVMYSYRYTMLSWTLFMVLVRFTWLSKVIGFYLVIELVELMMVHNAFKSKLHGLMKSLILQLFYVMCAYDPILSICNVLTPFSHFSPKYYVPVVEGLLTTFEEDMDSHSPSLVGPHHFENNVIS